MTSKKKVATFWKMLGYKIKDKSYDLIFTSHMLEHVPHFELEKTISEVQPTLKKTFLY